MNNNYLSVVVVLLITIDCIICRYKSQSLDYIVYCTILIFLCGKGFIMRRKEKLYEYIFAVVLSNL